MMSLPRTFAFSAAALCLTLALGATPALAKAVHHKHHAKTHHTAHHAKAKAQSGKAIVRIAQQHLANLGYYVGTVDGLMGPQTKEAIKNFQHDKGLKADGILGSKTKAALEAADGQVIGSHSIPLTREQVQGITVPTHPDYVTSLGASGKSVSSRFARVDIAETGSDAGKRYDVSLNGQQILTADGQPSVIGISPTYDLGNEDAVIFTTYSPDAATGCIYKTHVLALTSTGNQLLDIDNCTRAYQAQVTNGSLYIAFPESDDARAVGATWRVEGTTLERL